MATPTSTSYTFPNIRLDVSGTNIDAGNNDYDFNYNQCRFDQGFSVIVKTATSVDITILASNNGTDFADITADLFPGYTALTISSNPVNYAANVPIPSQVIRIRAARSNATNSVSFSVFFPKK